MKLSGLRLLRAAAVAFACLGGAAYATDLPPLPQGLSVPKTATRLPAFSMPVVGGGSARAEDYKGKVIVARFWATW